MIGVKLPSACLAYDNQNLQPPSIILVWGDSDLELFRNMRNYISLFIKMHIRVTNVKNDISLGK